MSELKVSQVSSPVPDVEVVTVSWGRGEEVRVEVTFMADGRDQVEVKARTSGPTSLWHDARLTRRPVQTLPLR